MPLIAAVALRVLLDGILPQRLGAARQLDCLQVHADCGDEDEGEATEHGHEVDVRLSRHIIDCVLRWLLLWPPCEGMCAGINVRRHADLHSRMIEKYYLEE